MSYPATYQDPDADNDVDVAPPPPPQQTPQQQSQSDGQLALLIAGILVTALTADAAFQELQLAITANKIVTNAELSAFRGALRAVMSFPPDRIEGTGPASAYVARLNLLRRAQFVVSAAHRITRELQLARAQGQPLGLALRDAAARERRFYGQHLQAIIQRTQAASQVDARAAEYGLLLGWYTVRDKKTSAECLRANGKNFYATSMPLIGFPGGVHPHCRCFPGKPHAGAAILPSVRMAA